MPLLISSSTKQAQPTCPTQMLTTGRQNALRNFRQGQEWQRFVQRIYGRHPWQDEVGDSASSNCHFDMYTRGHTACLPGGVPCSPSSQYQTQALGVLRLWSSGQGQKRRSWSKWFGACPANCIFLRLLVFLYLVRVRRNGRQRHTTPASTPRWSEEKRRQNRSWRSSPSSGMAQRRTVSTHTF